MDEQPLEVVASRNRRVGRRRPAGGLGTIAGATGMTGAAAGLATQAVPAPLAIAIAVVSIAVLILSHTAAAIEAVSQATVIWATSSDIRRLFSARKAYIDVLADPGQKAKHAAALAQLRSLDGQISESRKWVRGQAERR